MTVLVTGAGGLIGGHLVEVLERDRPVVAVARGLPQQQGGARWIVADLSLPGFVDALPTGVETIVHLAQSAHYQAFPEGAGDVFDVNVASTMRLLEWARRTSVKRFILAGAGGADRAVRPGPANFYLAGKLAAELLARSYAALMTVTVVRPFFVYGRGQRRTMLIPRLVDAVRTGRPITLAGDEGIRVTPTHVDDAVAAFQAAVLHHRPGTFDVAGPEVLTIREIAGIIGKRLGIEPRLEIVGGAAEDIVADTSRMMPHVEAPRRRFAAGLEDAI